MPAINISYYCLLLFLELLTSYAGKRHYNQLLALVIIAFLELFYLHPMPVNTIKVSYFHLLLLLFLNYLHTMPVNTIEVSYYC